MKFIITTTIQKPTTATLKFIEIAKRDNWQFVIVGDKKTPHDAYKDLNLIYLTPEWQETYSKELSDAIGWNTIQRRNMGLLYAYDSGADIVATIDDDNIPYENWGKNIYVGKTIECDLYETDNQIFEPLSVFNDKTIWHRGYPLSLLQKRFRNEYKGSTQRKVLIQSDLWNGDPDIDAMCRLTNKPIIKFPEFKPYCSNKPSPFNSQNTFLDRSVIPFYSCLPFTGRMDDIFGGYLLQQTFKDNLIYCNATVYQERNVQNLVKNMENEMIGYKWGYDEKASINTINEYLPEQTKQFMNIYRNSYV